MSSPEDPTDPDYLLQLLRIISTAISGSLEDRETLAEAYDHLPTDIVNSVIAMTSLALATDGQIKVIGQLSNSTLPRPIFVTISGCLLTS